MKFKNVDDTVAFDALIELSQKTINLILNRLDALGVSPDEFTLKKIMDQDVLKEPLHYLGAATFGLYMLDKSRSTEETH